jgi:hypothetical protein
MRRGVTADPAAALALGLAVFPLSGRVPAVADWAAAATRDPAAVAAWLPGTNPGIGCRANGLVVLDVDRHPGGADGADALARLCEAAGAALPVTLTVATPRDGSHLYYRAPAGWVLGSGSVAPGLDARGPGLRSGGYVLGPGSVVDGRPYTVADHTEIADLPGWLAPLLPGRPAPEPT